MANSILKSNWERGHHRYEMSKTLVQKLIQPLTKEAISSIAFMDAGCANTNYKLTFTNQSPLILRIYTRDKTAPRVEQHVKALLGDSIPHAKIFYLDDSCKLIEHPYTVLEFMPGILMRELIQSGNEAAIKQTMFQAGVYLDTLRAIEFEQSGFFQVDGIVRPFDDSEALHPYMVNLLSGIKQNNILGEGLIDLIHVCIENHQNLLTLNKPYNLVHGDYDPSNILVKQQADGWQITSILDWEFAFAGRFEFDIGYMLRYAHKLPKSYEQSFIQGIESKGFKLSKDWKMRAKLYDLVSLLQFCTISAKNSKPNLLADVTSLIGNTVGLHDS